MDICCIQITHHGHRGTLVIIIFTATFFIVCILIDSDSPKTVSLILVLFVIIRIIKKNCTHYIFLPVIIYLYHLNILLSLVYL